MTDIQRLIAELCHVAHGRVLNEQYDLAELLNRAAAALEESEAAREKAQKELDKAVCRIGATILALRDAPEPVAIPSSLRASIQCSEDEFFNRPTEVGKERRTLLEQAEARRLEDAHPDGRADG